MKLSMCHTALYVLSLGASFAVGAQQADHSEIQSKAASNVNGRLAINQASGLGNAQTNVMAVARGKLASSSIGVLQSADNTASVRNAKSTIQSGAFAGFKGALALNQAAGSNTLQANLFVIESRDGFSATDDSVLAQTLPGIPPTEGAGSAPEVSREARIDASAFRGASGVLQVNQSAGVGNAATNAVVVRLPISVGGI